MIRIGFIGNVSKEWMGGLNYFKNLLYAISTLKDKKIEIIVFVGRKTDTEIKTMFRQYAQVIEHPLFDRKSLPWFISKMFTKLFFSSIVLDKLLIKHRIDVLSHSSITGLKSCKTVNWIPDFQHTHLPHMFSHQEIEQRDNHYKNLAKKSDLLIVSSNDALKDFKKFTPSFIHKAKVLQFVSQPSRLYFKLNQEDEKSLRLKYSLDKNFFYLPNQFWKHKNHLIVFEAIKLLKDRNILVTLVCTGYLHDYRDIEHIDMLTNFINEYQLNNQIRFLGLVDYEEVFALIKYSEAVINPSLFEGWSSTVEECKSVNKNMILSDLEVHKEQYPTALFFERNNAAALANILELYAQNEYISPSTFDSKFETQKFAYYYQEIVKEVFNG